jgi:hypothetical protein
MANIYQYDPNFDRIVQGVVNKMFAIKVRGTWNTYEGKRTMQYTVVEIQPFDIVSATTELLA